MIAGFIVGAVLGALGAAFLRVDIFPVGFLMSWGGGLLGVLIVAGLIARREQEALLDWWDALEEAHDGHIAAESGDEKCLLCERAWSSWSEQRGKDGLLS